MIKFAAVEVHDKPNMIQNILLENGVWIEAHGDGTATGENGSQYLSVGDCWTDDLYTKPITATVTNPWTNSTYDRDVKDTTEGRLQGYLARYRDWETDRKSTRLNSSH